MVFCKLLINLNIFKIVPLNESIWFSSYKDSVSAKYPCKSMIYKGILFLWVESAFLVKKVPMPICDAMKNPWLPHRNYCTKRSIGFGLSRGLPHLFRCQQPVGCRFQSAISHSKWLSGSLLTTKKIWNPVVIRAECNTVGVNAKALARCPYSPCLPISTAKKNPSTGPG